MVPGDPSSQDPSSQEVFDALETILTDEDTFQKVVQSVFGSIDANKNGNVEAKELGAFLASVCGHMGVGTPPTSNQVLHVFKHLDLNSDNSVSQDELEVFLRHLFTEQMGQAREKLEKEKAALALASRAQLGAGGEEKHSSGRSMYGLPSRR